MGARSRPGFPHLHRESSQLLMNPDPCAQCWGRCTGMQLQLLQTHQALGWGNPHSLLTLLLHELVLCFICPIKGKKFPCILPSPP